MILSLHAAVACHQVTASHRASLATYGEVMFRDALYQLWQVIGVYTILVDTLMGKLAIMHHTSL